MIFFFTLCNPLYPQLFGPLRADGHIKPSDNLYPFDGFEKELDI
jgi:hypothetical protein